jgi:hypothetical protein
MTRPVPTWHGVGVQTLAQLQRTHRRLDRVRSGVAHTLSQMQSGQALHLSFEKGRTVWRLTNGATVHEQVAKVVVAHTNIVSCGDGLFHNCLGQTWRWAE